MDLFAMAETKTYRIPGVKVTVELEDNLTVNEHCPSDSDFVLFVQDRLLLHLKRN